MGPLARFCPGAIFRAAACVFLGVQLETSSSETLAPLQILQLLLQVAQQRWPRTFDVAEIRFVLRGVVFVHVSSMWSRRNKTESSRFYFDGALTF